MPLHTGIEMIDDRGTFSDKKGIDEARTTNLEICLSVQEMHMKQSMVMRKNLSPVLGLGKP
jgi:hypothetical protein